MKYLDFLPALAAAAKIVRPISFIFLYILLFYSDNLSDNLNVMISNNILTCFKSVWMTKGMRETKVEVNDEDALWWRCYGDHKS